MYMDSMTNLYDSENTAINQSILIDYTNKEIPTNIKELWKWVEYLAFNSGQVVSAMKKLTEFPITKPIFKTDNRSLREQKEKIARIAKYKEVSLKVGFDFNMYGNSLTSVYKPIVRYIICPKCKKKIRLTNAKYRYFPETDKFVLEQCEDETCFGSGTTTIEDIKDRNPNKVNIIRWDLKQIDVDYNEFSGKSRYFYTLTPLIKRKIRENNIDILSTYPRPFLALAGKDLSWRFKFAEDYIFHMKTPCLAGISNAWGFPPPTPALKSFFYQFMLRKANEAVALDYLNHLRVIYPAASQPENDPLKYINMTIWAEEMTSTLRKWRLDRNFVKLSPHPIGYQAVGGEGRSMLLSNEIREASYDILMTLGIPRELMEGSTAQNLGAPIYLRIVENMMMTYMEQLTEWLNWVDGKISDWLEMDTCEIEFVPFKFIDDIARKQMLMQWGQGGESMKISDSTISEQLDIDIDEEEDRIVEDKVRQYKLQKKIQMKIQEEETSLSQRAISEEQMSQGNKVDYNNQQQTMSQAEQTAAEIMQVPYEQRKSQLDALQKEDFVYYSVVKEMMEKIKLQQKNSVIQGAKTASLHREYPEGHFDSIALNKTLIELTNKVDQLEKKMEGSDGNT